MYVETKVNIPQTISANEVTLALMSTTGYTNESNFSFSNRTACVNDEITGERVQRY